MNQFLYMEQYHLMQLHQQHHLIRHYMFTLETTEQTEDRLGDSH